MGWHLAALVSRPLVLHLRQDPLPVVPVAPEVVNQNHVLAVSFGHELNDPTTSQSQSLRGEKVNTGEAGRVPGRWHGPSRRTAGCGPACQVASGSGEATRPGRLCLMHSRAKKSLPPGK